MNRRIAGLALDGRHDLAAVDWDEEGTAPVRVLHGGTLSDVITTLDGRLIGGPQAALAPHGRGGGWGPDVGAATRRRLLAAAVDGNGRGAHAADVAAAIDALARGAQEVIVAVPDLPGFDEVAQGAMIAAARKSSARSVRLLWRPVAAMLSLIHDRRLTAEHLGQRFRFLVHGAHGIEDQILTLREAPEISGHIAPQRDGPGRLWAAELGLDALFARADREVRDRNPVNWDRLESSRLGAKLVVGKARPGDRDVLRNNSGRWEVVTAPDLCADDLLTAAQAAPAPDAPCERVFLITPLQAPLAAALARALKVDACIEQNDHIARGCLHAGRLIERGLPHYFDRLEAISIAVLRDREPAFVPLIPEGHLVAANREYVSEDLSDFVWPRNKRETDFYILKGSSEVREWTVRKGAAPQTDVPIRMQIRQTPGQSWAVLDITATHWDLLARAPEKLDWEGLTPTDMSPEQVLDLLRTPPPAIPERLVEPAHPALWTGADWTGGDDRAARLAKDAAWTGEVDAASWAQVLSRALRHPTSGISYRRVTTDGVLPDGLPELVRNGFDVMLQSLADRLLHGPPLQDNNTLRALTWSFAACPAEVQDAILDALEADRRGQRHRLLLPRQAIGVLRQGSGRAVTGEHRLRRLFSMLTRAPLNNDTINALSMAVSRREEAPRALTRAQVDHFLHDLSEHLIVAIENRHFQVKFKNTLSAIAGLFRWREIEPFSLLAADDRVAADLQRALDRASNLLRQPQWQNVPARAVKIALLEKIGEFLVGEGDPAILRIIEES
ncbi:MAG: hypothetical protein JJU42_04550 [Rhodobacteraceae bacterium]|nr:hypothetical protein [Paracoccaceae bacterium]